VAFGSRAGLLDAFASDLFESGGFERVREAVRHPDARVSVREGIRGGAEVFAVHRDVIRTLVALAPLDPDGVGAAVARMERARAKGMGQLARRLDRAGMLRAGVDAREAADVLWVATGFDAFDTLYTGRGLPVEDVVRLLVAVAERTVCADPPAA
jgi:hypothetical protein